MNNRVFKLNDTEQRAIQAQEAVTSDVKALKRLQAVRLYGSGQAMSVVETVVGSSRRTIQRWVGAYQTAGIAGLRPQFQGANAKKLKDEQRAELVQRLRQYRPDQILSREVRISQGSFWTVSDVQLAVKQWYGVVYRSADSYRALLHEADFSYQRSQTVYRSKPCQADVAQFEEALEKKSSTFAKPIPTAGS